MGLPAHRRATWDDMLAAEAAGLACEIVNGELVEKAAGDDRHGDALFQVPLAIGDAYGRRGGGGRPGGWWLRSEVDIFFERDHIYRPDISGWRRDRVEVMPDEFPTRIPPDWVCEVLSPSTAHRDLGVKMDVYHRHGVGHYWVIDRAHRLLVVYRHGPNAYERVLAAEPERTVRAEPFDAIEIFVGRFFGVEPPEE